MDKKSAKRPLKLEFSFQDSGQEVDASFDLESWIADVIILSLTRPEPSSIICSDRIETKGQGD